jgi:hypothetical protein
MLTGGSMPVVDIRETLSELARKRLVFHSEADFQHALAWEIHERWPRCSMRLEFKPLHLGNRIYSDIWAVHDNAVIAIELKYKTRRLLVKVGEETFDLLNQSAQDVGRYDFLRDIERLEQMVAGRSDIVGYAILLTNDSAYGLPPENRSTLNARLL